MRFAKKSDLNEIQIKALKEQGFEQVNQFDILEKKFISVLIKPYEKLNHSREHISILCSPLLSQKDACHVCHEIKEEKENNLHRPPPPELLQDNVRKVGLFEQANRASSSLWLACSL